MRLLAILTLSLYGFTAVDMHTWVRVPQVVLHLLEHHSDFGHHHESAVEHGHADDEDGHNPFDQDDHGACGALSLVSLPIHAEGLTLAAPFAEATFGAVERTGALASYSGSKWNPPKLG